MNAAADTKVSHVHASLVSTIFSEQDDSFRMNNSKIEIKAR